MKLFKLHLAQDRIHHNQKPDGCVTESEKALSKNMLLSKDLTNRDRDAHKFPPLQSWACGGDEIAEKYANQHREKDPHGQKAV